MSKVAFVREIDDLGRIVIPREYRDKIFGEHNSEGKKMEIFLEKDGSLILKPYKTEPDIREKVTEYINELDTEITRITNDLLKENNSDDNAKLEARLDAIVDVKNDLLSRLGEKK